MHFRDSIELFLSLDFIDVLIPVSFASFGSLCPRKLLVHGCQPLLLYSLPLVVALLLPLFEVHQGDVVFDPLELVSVPNQLSQCFPIVVDVAITATLEDKVIFFITKVR